MPPTIPITDPSADGPLAIGGLGGSGTRVVAQIFIESGFHFGDDLNLENDNLWFTLLFKRPRWLEQAGRNEIARGFEILAAALTGRPIFSPAKIVFLLRAAIEMSRRGHHPSGIGKGRWPFERAWRIWRATFTKHAADLRWGWKEPNTHLVLADFLRVFPAGKFIHVIRHGLDMAFSENQQQLHFWGPRYGITAPAEPSALPVAALQYWLRANQRACELGRAAPGRFLLLNFDELCAHPAKVVREMLDFAGVTVSEPEFKRLCRLPELPRGSGRYRTKDLSIFPVHDLRAVEEFGFPVSAGQ